MASESEVSIRMQRDFVNLWNLKWKPSSRLDPEVVARVPVHLRSMVQDRYDRTGSLAITRDMLKAAIKKAQVNLDREREQQRLEAARASTDRSIRSRRRRQSCQAFPIASAATNLSLMDTAPSFSLAADSEFD